jgi:hypothetical protein
MKIIGWKPDASHLTLARWREPSIALASDRKTALEAAWRAASSSGILTSLSCR